MGFYEFIEKSISKGRGYKYHTYETKIDKNKLKLYHHETKILEIDLKKKKVLYYYIYGVSDAQAIGKVLGITNINGFVYRYDIYISKRYRNFYFSIRVDIATKENLKKIKNFLSQFDKETLKKLNNLNFNSKIKLVEKIIYRNITKKDIEKIIKLSENIKKSIERRKKLFEKLSKNKVLYLNNGIVLTTNNYHYLVIFYLDYKVYKTYNIRIKNNCVFIDNTYYNDIDKDDIEIISKLKNSYIKNFILSNIISEKV